MLLLMVFEFDKTKVFLASLDHLALKMRWPNLLQRKDWAIYSERINDIAEILLHHLLASLSRVIKAFAPVIRDSIASRVTADGIKKGYRSSI
jgi:hypothetical protein